jgi:hypothetical protein
MHIGAHWGSWAMSIMALIVGLFLILRSRRNKKYLGSRSCRWNVRSTMEKTSDSDSVFRDVVIANIISHRLLVVVLPSTPALSSRTAKARITWT